MNSKLSKILVWDYNEPMPLKEIISEAKKFAHCNHYNLYEIVLGGTFYVATFAETKHLAFKRLEKAGWGVGHGNIRPLKL